MLPLKLVAPALITASFLGGGQANAQSTQGLITGRVIDRQTREPLAVASVRYWRTSAGSSGSVTPSGTTRTSADGYYTLALLTPGTYRLLAEAADYQAQEINELELYVAGRLELDFTLRPLGDVWEVGGSRTLVLDDTSALVNFYAADVQNLSSTKVQLVPPKPSSTQPTLSYVIDSRSMENLPLGRRDIYTTLVMQPGVTADNATGRGLGLSINGQRPSSSNFLLDGVEHNKYLTTGPLSAVAPEAIREYRVSTNNFSAEFGGTSGFLANAVTRSGSNSFHGLVYGYVNNRSFNANTFQRNASSPYLPRAPQDSLHAGFWAGGPIPGKPLHFSTAFERFRFRSRGLEKNFEVPVTENYRACPDVLPESEAMRLLQRFPPPQPTVPPAATQYPCKHLTAPYKVEPRLGFDRYLFLQRFDYRSPTGSDAVMVRFTASRLTRPDFIFSPYKGFSSDLHDDSNGIALNYTRPVKPNLVNELRLGWREAELAWQRPHPEIPTLSVGRVILPGSPASYEFRNTERSWEVTDSLVMVKGRHVLTVGGGLLLRHLQSLLSYGRDGLYRFDSALEFGKDDPFSFRATVKRKNFREDGSRVQPRYDRSQTNNQFFGFVQHNFRVSPRLWLSTGLRYESFGSPKNTEVQDGYLELGPGDLIEERLSGAELSWDRQQRRIYRPDRDNWAGRFGVAYDLFGQGKTVLRASYGVFFDRPFDNLTLNSRNNNIEELIFCRLDTNCPNSPGTFAYPLTVEQVLGRAQGKSLDFPDVFWVDDGLRTPYVQSWFAGVQHRPTSSLTLEINHMGAEARKLVATDRVNREYSLPCRNAIPPEETCPSDNRLGRFNPGLGDIVHRANSGSSSYAALGALIRYRTKRSLLQVAYTWSHSIDNQSDPLLGDFFDLSFADTADEATFTEQFDSRVDRGNSDFDQRHNLLFHSIWELPGMVREGWLRHLLAGWQVSQLAGFRSGFPYTVFSGLESSSLLRNRPNLVAGQTPERSAPIPLPLPARGGLTILNPEAFEKPADGTVGNVGRNSLIGPGFWGVDFSVSKYFPFPWLGEAGRIAFRADFFNVFNHSNLGNPDGRFDRSTFGEALFGRTGRASSFPTLLPLDETPRQIQLQLKLYF